MFVFDTNVLLNLYRYSGSTRGQLLGVLEALGDRLFLPHQVGREFLDNRLRTIRAKREGLKRLREGAEGVAEATDLELRKVMRLRPEEDLPERLRAALENVSKGYEDLIKRLGELEHDVPRASNSPEDDEVWAAVERLFDGKVGPSYGEEEMREAEEEAGRRREAKAPPGFKDDGPGDYLVWRQTVDEAKRSGRMVVLVTDERKEDWWWIEHGETLGPRRILVEEMRRKAGVPFYMYKPDRLMEYVRDRLGLEVSDDAIDEAKGLRPLYPPKPEPQAEEEIHRAVLANLLVLDPGEETVTRAYYLDQEGVEEIAAKRNMEESTVSHLLRTASEKLTYLDTLSLALSSFDKLGSWFPPRHRRHHSGVYEDLLRAYRRAWDVEGAEDPGHDGGPEAREVAVRLLRALPRGDVPWLLLEALENPKRNPSS